MYIIYKRWSFLGENKELFHAKETSLMNKRRCTSQLYAFDCWSCPRTFVQLQKYCLTDMTERFTGANLKNRDRWFHCQTAKMQQKGLEYDLIKVQHNSLLWIFNLLYSLTTSLNLKKHMKLERPASLWRAEMSFQKILINLKGACAGPNQNV